MRRPLKRSHAPTLLASALLAVSATVAVAEIPITAVGDTVEGFVLEGAEEFDFVGFAVSGVGDVNADGFADFAVGVPGLGEGGGLAIVLGGPGLDRPTLDALAEGRGGVIHPGAPGLDVGSAVAPLGAQDSGRNPVVIVGAPLYSGTTRTESGAAIMFRSPDTTPRQLGVGAAGTGSLRGSQANEKFGTVMSLVGDVDGDGVPDLLVGSPEKRNGNNVATGGAWLVRGQLRDGTTVDLATEPTQAGEFLLLGDARTDLAGWSVTGVGDFNGDGIPDMAVGAPGAEGGQVALVWGSATTASVLTFNGLATAGRGVVYTTAVASDSLGSAVAGPGDLNGDGLADLVVGSPSASPLGRAGAGTVHIIWGSTTPRGGELAELVAEGHAVAIHGAAERDWAGYTIAPAGDTNGDGLMDLLLSGANAERNGLQMAGAVWHIESPTAWPAELDLAEEHPGVRQFVGTEEFGQLGLALGTVGDWDANGTDDVALAAPLAGDSGSLGRGRVYTVLGGAPPTSVRYTGVLRRNAAVSVSPGSPGNLTTMGGVGLRLHFPSQSTLSTYAMSRHRAAPDFAAARGNTHTPVGGAWWELESDRTVWTNAGVSIPLAPLGIAAEIDNIDLLHATGPDSAPTRPQVIQRTDGVLVARVPGPGRLWLARRLPPVVESITLRAQEGRQPEPYTGYTSSRSIRVDWTMSGLVTRAELSNTPTFTSVTTQTWDSFELGPEGTTFNFDLPAGDGPKDVSIRLVGPLGTSPSLTGRIVLDTQRPSFTLNTSPYLANTIPPVITGRLTEANPRTLTFAVGTTTGTLTLTPDGADRWNWTIPPAATGIAAEGLYPITLEAVDEAGWVTTSNPEVLVDITPPASRVASGPTSQLGGITMITASVTADNGSSTMPGPNNRLQWYFRRAGGEWTLTAQTQSLQGLLTPPLGSGRYWVRPAAADAAGNREPAPTGFNPPGSWSFAYAEAANDVTHVLQFPGESFVYPMERASVSTGGSTRFFIIAHVALNGTAADGETSLTMQRQPAAPTTPPAGLAAEGLVAEWIDMAVFAAAGPYTIEWKMPAANIPAGLTVDRIFVQTPNGIVAHPATRTEVPEDQAVVLTAEGVVALGPLFAGEAAALAVPPGAWMLY